MPLPGILDEFETLQNHFLELKNKRKKQGKKMKNREIEISMEIFYRSPPKTEISTEISEIFFPVTHHVHLLSHVIVDGLA